MKKNNSILLVFIFSLFLLWSRLIPHQANLSPTLALFLLSGWLGRNRWYALCLPFLAFLISDIYLGFYPGWVFNYICFILVMFFGFSMKKTLASFLVRGCGAAVLFFLVSNLGVWMTSGLYDLNGWGFFLCYKMAIPFFKTSLVSTTLFLTGFYLLGAVYGQSLKKIFVFR